MALGAFWMTKIIEGAKGEGKFFSSPNALSMPTILE
jgi:hypothetical protein